MLLLGKVFDWHSIFFGKENWSYLPQAALKTVFMFIVVVVSLRLIGRRGIMQGVFQVLTIIMLGSAAGDPMLYSEVGLLPATAVFIMIVILYKVADFIIAKYSKLETITEGDTIRLIKDSKFDIKNFSGKELSKDEILADLRVEGVSHLGQVNTAYMEAGGQISVFYNSDDQVKYGLPILPERYDKQLIEIKEDGIYSCAYCGFTEELHITKDHECSVCKKNKWVRSINERRVT